MSYYSVLRAMDVMAVFCRFSLHASRRWFLEFGRKASFRQTSYKSLDLYSLQRPSLIKPVGTPQHLSNHHISPSFFSNFLSLSPGQNTDTKGLYCPQWLEV